MSVLVRGGRIVSASGEFDGDVLVEDGRITLVGKDLRVAVDREIDATGKLVIPGAIDPHTHLDMAFGPVVTADDFTSGTVAAAFGGTTTLIDFCTQIPGQSFAEALANYHSKLERTPPVIDVGFHIGVTDLTNGGSLEELASLPGQGVTSYKLFMAYKGSVMADDELLFQTMRVARDTGALVMVHAENGDVIDVLVKDAVAAGHTAPIWHARTRPPETEGEATNRAIQLAHIAGCALYVVHVSCREALEPIAIARAKGWDVIGETCPQYLFIDESFLDRPDFEGAKAIYTPPPRPKENQEHLWKALETGVLSVVSTDHCPYRFADQKSLGRDSFTAIPNGGPGIENRLHLLYQHGVRTGRLTMSQLVDLTSTRVAREFGLAGRKGVIAPGADADIVLWDTEKELTISAATHHSGADYSLYEGTVVRGAPSLVMVRGEVVVEDDRLVTEPGYGQFLRRSHVR